MKVRFLLVKLYFVFIRNCFCYIISVLVRISVYDNVVQKLVFILLLIFQSQCDEFHSSSYSDFKSQ